MNSHRVEMLSSRVWRWDSEEVRQAWKAGMPRQQMKKQSHNAFRLLCALLLDCASFLSLLPDLSSATPLFPSPLSPVPPQPSARPSIPWTGRRSGATLSPSSASSATTTCRRRFTASRSLAPSGTPTNRSRGSCGWSTRTLAKVGQSHQSLPHEAASPLKMSHFISA